VSSLPDLDPRQPGIYMKILETAAEVRGRRMMEGAAKRMADLHKHNVWIKAVQKSDRSRFGPDLDDRVAGLEGQDDKGALHPVVDSADA
jgi:hypothetical protein